MPVFAALFAVLFFVAALSGLPGGAPAQDRPGLAIAAIVNHAPVSNYDLDQYVRLLLVMAGLRVTPENEARIRARSLERLIEDILRRQEARRINITVSEREVEQAIDSMIARNNSSRDSFNAFLRERGIAPETLHSRFMAELAWEKVVGQTIAPEILLSEQEIEESFQSALRSLDEPGYLLSEIFLSAARIGGEKEAVAQARRLRRQLAEGASFAALAGEFSDAPSAAQGGDVGWLQRDALNERLAEALGRLEPGGVSVPIRTDDGVYLLYLRDRRLSRAEQADRWRVHLASVFVPKERAGSAPDTEANWRSKVAAEFPGCGEAEAWAAGFSGRAKDLGEIESADLSRALREAVAVLEPNRAAQVQSGAEGVDIIVLCEKTQARQLTVTRESVEIGLLNRHAEMLSRQRLRDLRRGAHVELR